MGGRGKEEINEKKDRDIGGDVGSLPMELSWVGTNSYGPTRLFLKMNVPLLSIFLFLTLFEYDIL